MDEIPWRLMFPFVTLKRRILGDMFSQVFDFETKEPGHVEASPSS
jgi:hypothetical protein